MAKWGMVIDLEKCTGCQACSTACAMENNLLPGENWQDVLYYTEGEYPSAQLKWFPRPCMQCESPSCVHVCPVKATYKTDDGVVLIDWDRCIGCRYCIIACPYGVRFFADENPQVEPNLRSVFKGDGDRAWGPPWRDAGRKRGPQARHRRTAVGRGARSAPSATTASARRPRARRISTRAIRRCASSRRPAS